MTGAPDPEPPGAGSPLLGETELGDALPRLRAAVTPSREIAGWATVELDRAERDLLADGTASGPAVAVAPDPTLGAFVRRINLATGDVLLLLEPSTEGPLAAALARHGEGPLVRYLVARPGAAADSRAAGFRLSTPGSGPLGVQRLVLAGPRWGPFLVLVEG